MLISNVINRNIGNFRGENHQIEPEIFSKLRNTNDEKSVLLFIRKERDLISPINTEGDHIIHVIVKKDYYETLKQMLHNPEQARKLLELRGQNGKTPLAIAKSGKCAKLMLTKGANPYALDDDLVPAGTNQFLPNEVRTKVQEVTAEKLKNRTIQHPHTQPPQQINPRIDTTPLRESAAKKEYSGVNNEGNKTKISSPIEQNSTKTDGTVSNPNKTIPSASAEVNGNADKVSQSTATHDKKSFFSMFTPKAKKEDSVEVHTENATEFVAKHTPKNNVVKTPNTKTEVQEPAIVEESKKEIKIKGTERFKRLDTPEIPSLDYIVGLNNIKQTLRTSIVEPVINEKIVEELSRNLTTIPNGILFNAPPGNGKTTLTKALGAEASMPVFEVADPDEMEELLKAIGKNFNETRQRAIIYMRGLDNLYSENNPTGQLTNVLNRLLNNTSDNGALMVFSVECAENLPKTILTPGKIDKILSFKSPDTDARLEYITRYIRNKQLLKDIDVTKVAEKTQGFSIAQLKHVIDDAVLYSATELQERVTTSDLLGRIKEFSKEQNIPEINEFNKTSMYDTTLKRYQPTPFDAENFESIAGMPTTKTSVEESILKPWENADKLRAAKIQLPTGGVFAGDPGTSKTYMAKALARSLNIPLYTLKMSEVGSSYVHETSKRIGRIIDQLITKYDETGEASILLMDEIDHFQKDQSQHGAEEVNTLLQEIERGRNKILFIGTTNEIEKLPDSLTRDGRMGSVIHFEHCDEKAAGAIIKNMLTMRKDNLDVAKILENNELLEAISKRCSGMVAASVSEIVNDAIADSVVNGTNLDKAFDTAVTVRKKKEIEKMLSKNSKCAGHRLNITEDSTIMYDTKYPRMEMSESDPKGLDSLGGMNDIKSTLRSEIIETYEPETLQLLKENKLPITKGFILHGPPGNGKTTIIKALANEMKLPIYPLNSGNIGSAYIHQLAKNAQEVREQLALKFKKTGERSILFMDEAQQLVPKTSGSMMTHSHNVEETNFFKDMIMTAQQDGIIYAMATNDLNQIEPAFYENSDRLGVCVYVGNPDLESRLGIISKLIADRPAAKALNNSETIQKIAEMFEGFSISKISQSILNLVRNSIKSKKAITLESSIELIRKMR